MSHPPIDPVPPVAATIGRLRWHTDVITREPGRHTADQLAILHTASLDLAIASGDPRGYLAVVQALAVAQATMEREPSEETAVKVQRLLDELTTLAVWQRKGAEQVRFQAQWAACVAAEQKRSKR